MPRKRPDFQTAWSTDPKYVSARLYTETNHGHTEINGEVATPYGIVVVSSGSGEDEVVGVGPKPWAYTHFQFVVKGSYVSVSERTKLPLTKRRLAYWAKRIIREANDVSR